MALITCSECGARVSDKAAACPKCGNPINPPEAAVWPWFWGYEWKSSAQICGWPLVHIAIGFKRENGRVRLLVARGIIAIGQFGLGLITIAQFGVGLITVAQFGIGLLFGLGQFMAGMIARGQFAAGVDAKGQLIYRLLI